VERARPAEDHDLGVCAELLGTALGGLRALRGGELLLGVHTAPELLGRWTSGATATAAALFVGEFEGAVVGMAAATTFTRRGAAVPSGRIECCYVEPGGRGVGVGTALMGALVSWCTGRGCRDVDALALPGDRSTKQRLEAAGLSARLLTLNRRLD